MQHRYKGHLFKENNKNVVSERMKEFYFYSKTKNVNAAIGDFIEEKMLNIIFGDVKGIFIKNPDMSSEYCKVDIVFQDGKVNKYITFEIEYQDSWIKAS